MALAPFIVALTAFYFFSKQIAASTGTGAATLDIIISLATAGYAFGALLGGDFIQRFPQRYLFFYCEGLFVIGSILSAAAMGPGYNRNLATSSTTSGATWPGLLYSAGRLLPSPATKRWFRAG